MRNRMFLLLSLFVLIAVSFFCCSNDDDDGGLLEPDGQGPNAPHDPYPHHYAQGMSRTPLFSWECEDADGDHLTYTLRLKEKGSSTILYSVETGYSYHQYPGQLNETSEYEWSIYAEDEHLNSIQGEPWYFTTGTGFNNPPARPFDFDPPEGYRDQPLELTLRWDCFDPDGDPLTYDVWFYADGAAPVRIGEKQAETSYAVGGLAESTLYRWIVRAFDSHGDSATAVSSFYTERGAVPDPPFDPFPADGATGVPVTVMLSWSCSHPEGSPLVYDVLFAPDAWPSLEGISADQIDTFFVVSGLEYNTAYRWSIRATDAAGDETRGPSWRFTTGDPSQPAAGVYAELIIGRTQIFNDFDQTLTMLDMVSARFDSVYTPGGPIKPLQAASVTCTTSIGYDIPWSAMLHKHFLDNTAIGHFLTPGHEYTFVVEAGGGVPALTESIVYPACTPYITSPAAGASVSRSGFELQWANHCGGTVIIIIEDLTYGSTTLDIVTDDDGSYTFTAGDLSVLDPMSYQIQVELITENRRNILAPGYDSRSFIWGRTRATQILNLNS